MADEQKPAGAGAPETGGEQKPAEQKPAGEQKAGEQKPAEKAGEQKPAEKAAEQKPEPGSKAAEEKPEAKAPEKYELKLPDGAKDWLDENDLKAIETTAKAKGWTNDQAQTVLNEHAEALAAQSAAFRAATEADTTYGGDKLQDTQRLGSLALDKLRPKGTTHGDAFRSLLVKSGYGNNLEVVSFLADLGKLMAEDSHVAGGGAADQRGSRDAATVLYGESKT